VMAIALFLLLPGHELVVETLLDIFALV